MPRRVILAALPLVLLACAAQRAPSPGNVARASFEPGRGDAVFHRAVRAFTAAGYRLHTCDAERRLLETGAVEFDAPCGRTTCLARQTVQVKLGYRAARVKVEREIFDGGWRTWQSDDAGGAVVAARALVLDIVANDAAADEAPADPCAVASIWAPSRIARAQR